HLLSFCQHAVENVACCSSIVAVVVHAPHPLVEANQAQLSLFLGFCRIRQSFHQCLHLAELHVVPLGSFCGGWRLYILWQRLGASTAVLCGEGQMGQGVECIDIVTSRVTTGEHAPRLISVGDHAAEG